MADAATIAKRISDKSIGYLNQGTKWLLQVLDPANKNLFEIIMFMSTFTNLKMGLHSIMDFPIARIYVQSIDVPFMSFEYENYNEVKEIKDLKYPDEISITFVENEVGFVINYLNFWIQQIVQPDYLNGRPNAYYFKPDQNGVKKNGVIVPLMGLGLPLPGIITFKGLKPMGIENITFSHGDGDPLLITCKFSVDDVWFKTLSGLLA